VPADRRAETDVPLRQRLARGDVLTGVFSFTGSSSVVELAGATGYDFVVIDCEHAAVSPYGALLENLVRAADAGGACAIVRTPSADRVAITKALDAGAAAVLVPQVASAGEASQAVGAATRAPQGSRGAAPMVRAGSYGSGAWPSFIAATRGPAVVGALVESVAGVDAADEIAAVEGLGFLFFGAYDFALDLGVDDPAEVATEVDEARSRVYAAANRAGIAIGDHAATAEQALALAAQGAQLVTLAADVVVLVRSLEALLGEFRAGRAARPAG
jgi:2-keto-3-deoxy-L-rhamnonate aldolase RhmA